MRNIGHIYKHSSDELCSFQSSRSRNVRAVILDLTGVAVIDAASVEHLGRMHRAIRLVGSDCLFSGISGQTAALMTQIGIDLDNWKTFATVRQALATFSGPAKGIYKRAGS